MAQAGRRTSRTPRRRAEEHESIDCSEVPAVSRWGPGYTARGNPYNGCQKQRKKHDTNPSFLGWPPEGEITFRCASTLEADQRDYNCGQCTTGDSGCANDYAGEGFDTPNTPSTGITTTWWCCTTDECNDPDGNAALDAAALVAFEEWKDVVRAVCTDGTFAEFEASSPSTVTCQTCPHGKIDRDGDPVTPCDSCDPGEDANADRTACQNCAPGRVGMTFIPGCLDCEPGRFSTVLELGGKTVCADCAAGTYAPVRSDSCVACASLGLEDHDSDPATACREGFRYYYNPEWTEAGQCWPSCETMGGLLSEPWGRTERQACCASSCGACDNRWQGSDACGTAGSTATGTDCVDVENFSDELGSSCSGWVGNDCADQQQATDWGYSSTGMEAVRTSCRASCGLCEPTDPSSGSGGIPARVDECCPLYQSDDEEDPNGLGILQRGVSCLVDHTPPCFMEGYGRQWAQATGWTRVSHLPASAGSPVLAVGAGDVGEARCVRTDELGLFRDSAQRRVFSGDSNGPDNSFERWSSVCVSCTEGAYSTLFVYTRNDCEPYSLVKSFALTQEECASDSERGLSYIATCDVVSRRECPQPPGRDGLRVIEHSDRDCASDPVSDVGTSGYYVALNAANMGTCETAAASHEFAYATDDLFGPQSTSGSFKVYRYRDESCTERDTDNLGLQFELPGCFAQSTTLIRYTAFCADAAKQLVCPPLIPQEEGEASEVGIDMTVASTATVTTTFEEDIDEILESQESRESFEETFRQTVGGLLDVSPDRIIVLAIVPGSFSVTFQIVSLGVDTESALDRALRLQTIIEQQRQHVQRSGTSEAGIRSPDTSTFFGTALRAYVTPEDGEVCDPPSACEWSAAPPAPPPPPPPPPESEAELPLVIIGSGAVATCLLMVVGTLNSPAYKRWTGARVYKQAAKVQASKAKRKKLWLKAEMEVRRALSEGRHLQQQQPGGADKAQKLLLKQSLVVLRILFSEEFSESSYPLSKFLGELQQLVTLAQEGIVPELSKWFLLLEQVLSVIGTPGSFAGLAQVNNFVGSEAYQKPSYYQKVAVENEESDHLSSLNRGDDTAKKTVWVGDIPEDIADSPQALSEALRVFGKVLSLTVRKKPGDCKSWALATFVEVHAARTATSRARLVFKDGGGQPVKVQIRTSKVDQELNKEGTGALAATWASQEQKLEAAVRIQAAMRGSLTRKQEGRRETGGQAGAGGRSRRRSTTASDSSGAGRPASRSQRSSVEKRGKSSDVKRRRSGAEKNGGLDALPEAQLSVWVGGLPESCADSPSMLTAALTVFGKVLSVTVRKKDGHRASWALASFVEKSAADHAVEKGGVEVRDRGKKVWLEIKKAQFDSELKKRQTGALASTWAAQEQKIVAATRIQAVLRGSISRKRSQQKQTRRRSSSEKTNEAPARRRSSAEREDTDVKPKNSVRRGSVKSRSMRRRRDSVDEAVVEEDDEVAPGSATTVWVGGLPENCADDPAVVTDALKVFGQVLSVTVRAKPGHCKSWAFATFVDQASRAQAASAGSLTVADGTGKAVTLTLKAAKVDKELKKEGTGALATMWTGQEQKIVAAVRIQAMARGSRARRAKQSSRRRSGARTPG